MEIHNPILSTHLTPAKDRGLVIALLRMSEKRSLKDEFVIEKVVYCGTNEPFKGWINVAPIARYSGGNRPEDDGMEMSTKRRVTRKTKQLESRESLTNIYTELIGMSTRADGHYHASITIQELYDEYKRRQSADDHSKQCRMIDPITFRYIPIDERTDDESDNSFKTGQLKLPVLKMTHASRQAKLLEVLESFRKRKPSDDYDNKEDAERYAVKGRDVASFYDKYRWYFKDKQSRLNQNIKTKRRGKKTGKKKTNLGGKGFISESESETSKSQIFWKNKNVHQPTYVIHVRDDKSNATSQETITFERKTDHNLSAPGGPGIDRWVAHVTIKDHNAPDEVDSVTSVADSRITEKSSQASQMSKSQDVLPQRQLNKTQGNIPNYRLGKRNNRKRQERKFPSHFSDVDNSLSSGETAKVSVKYNVSMSKKHGSLSEFSEESSLKTSSTNMVNKENRNLAKNKTSKPAPEHSQKYVVSSSDKLKLGTKQVIPMSKNISTLDTISDENEDTESQFSPLPQIIAKRPILNVKHTNTKQSKRKKKVMNSTEKSSISTPRTFESSEERRIKTPSSSTFNPDRMFQQMKDTADFITKAPMLAKGNKSSPRFLTNIEDARTSEAMSSISKSNSNTRKPLHPKYNKNRAQDRLQRMIDDEKALISGVIQQLNTNWQQGTANRHQLEPVPGNIQDALTTAIAKARLAEMQISGLSGPFGTQKYNTNHVMKRRGVPPLKERSSVSTTMVGSQENFFIADSMKHIPVKPSVATMKPSLNSRKIDNGKLALSNEVRSLSKDRNETLKRNKLQPGIRFVADGDFLITKPHSFAPIVPRNFEASISSIKPARRIANVNQVFDIRQKA